MSSDKPTRTVNRIKVMSPNTAARKMMPEKFVIARDQVAYEPRYSRLKQPPSSGISETVMNTEGSPIEKKKTTFHRTQRRRSASKQNSTER